MPSSWTVGETLNHIRMVESTRDQATSLLIRAIALQEVQLRDWWRIALLELPTGVILGAILGIVGVVRIAVWQGFGIFAMVSRSGLASTRRAHRHPS